MITPYTHSIHHVGKLWQAAHERKLLAAAIAAKLRDLGKAYPCSGYAGRAYRMQDCSTYLEITYNNDSARISRANYCRDRLCPMCAWRRSRNNFAGVMAACNYIRSHCPTDKTNQWLHLTLTVQNCTPDTLGDTINLMMAAWDRVSKRRTWRKAYLGYARSMEITYNADNNTMHPHMHILLHAAPDYYDSAYMDNAALEHQWLSALGSLYQGSRAFISIQRIKPSQHEEPMETAIAEVTKYLCKSVALPTMPQTTLHHFAQAVAGRRLLALGGDIAAAARVLNYDPDSTNQIESVTVDDSGMHTLVLQWSHAGNAYYIERDL